MPISPARIAAYEILLRIDRDRSYSSVLLPLYESGLSEKDRSLCHQIVLGVLRKKYVLDHAITQFADRKKLDIEIRTSLRIGVYQLLFLDRVPAHSAVNDSVALVQRAKKSSAKGFVNAILRKLAGGVFAPVVSEGLDRVSIETSHPRWLLDRWSEQFGEGRSVAIATANNEPSRLAFRVTKLGGDGDPEPPTGCLPSGIVQSAFTADRLTFELREAADRGEIYFQDEASQLVASSVSIPNGGRFLDVCAAPGGKTTQIGSRSSAMMVAGDLHQTRVEFLRANAIRQGVPLVHVIRYNAESALPFAEECFDTILLDAPCSGTGTIRSNPEIRYFLKPEDILEVSSKQLRILNNASKLLKKGGSLYYSTCSLEREENEGVVARFIEQEAEFSIDPSPLDLRFSTSDGFLRTFPDRDGTDGFFLAILRRD